MSIGILCQVHALMQRSQRSGLWIQFHFPTSTTPTRYLALRGSFGAEGKYKTTLSVSKGGDCIDCKEEHSEIRRLYEKALAEEGIKSSMAPSLYAWQRFVPAETLVQCA